MFKFIKLAVFIAGITTLSVAQNVIKTEKGYMFGDRIVVKFSGIDLTKSSNLPASYTKVLERFGIVEFKKRFKLKTQISKADLPLNKIAVLKFSSPVSPEYLASKIRKLKGIEWAEPYYLDEIQFTPNDPDYSTQYALAKIQAAEAWDVTTGNPDIIVAIDDTGVDWDHPDLADNIWVNQDEIDGNGIDDDNNGYVDDVRGWDFGGVDGTPDNDPKEDRADHGTHVAGIVSAVTNNGIGISSIGFNTTIMPVKTSRDDVRDDGGNPLIAYGYDGIIYAIENGAKVINCSWGSYNYSSAAQEVINYAVQNGVLVVGAAGNESLAEVIFPGAYDGALSVGATTSTDTRASFSNYGKYVEVMSPGLGIWSTWQNDTYRSLSGTSMASPLVAGLAALVYDRFPSYNPYQIAEQIRATCDNIDSVNTSLEGLLGSGRVNAFKAVSTNDAKSVRLSKITFTDAGDGDGIFKPGETVNVEAEFTNYLNPLTALSITMESKTNYASMINASATPGAVATLTKTTANFSFIISNDCPENEELEFLFNYSEDGLNGFDWTNVLANPTYRTQSGNKLAVTLTSKGTIGFNDYPGNLQGDGLSYDNSPNLIFEGALMLGSSKSRISNCARDNTGNNQDDDFLVVKPFVLSVPGEDADQQGFAVFNDAKAGFYAFGIETKFYSYSFADNDNDDYMILRYKLKNNSDKDITGLHAGLYFDWDMDESDYADNVTDYDTLGGFGYAYNSDFDPVNMYLTCANISGSENSFYAITNDGSDGDINVYDGFTDAEKWTTLSSGINKVKAGPNDISTVSGGGTYNIPAGDSIDVAFAIAGGYSLEELRIAIENAKNKYSALVTDVKDKNEMSPLEFNLSQNYPNPFNPSTTIKYTVPDMVQNLNAKSSLQNVSLMVYDILGRKVATLVNQKQAPGNYTVVFDASSAQSRLPSGVYIYRLNVQAPQLNGGFFTDVKKMILLK